MKRAVGLVFAGALIVCGACGPAAFAVEDEEGAPPLDVEKYRYYSTRIQTNRGTAPACTPFTADHWGRKKIKLRDPNESWGSVKFVSKDFEALLGFDGFDQCVAAVPYYSERMTLTELEDVSHGKISAGMPVEIALMIFGPPTEDVSRVSWLNPMTGLAENRLTYTWTRAPEADQLRTFFSILGAASFGVAAVTSNLHTAIGAARIGVAASSAERIAMDISSLSAASVVVVQSDGHGLIQMLTETGPGIGRSTMGPPPEIILPRDQWITYEVSGTACGADISYRIADGSANEENAKLEWSVTFRPENKQALYVIAKNRCSSGSVTSTIKRGEKVLKTVTNEAARGTAMASLAQ